ncbi:hypothetical protein WP50_26485 [Lactiplantibacillus plantarum]|nr:hypothetical protein WP50_26485 [Lactiplantibacillus plantarum]
MGPLKTLKLTLLRASFNLLYQLFYFLGGPRKHRVTFATMRSNQLTDNFTRERLQNLVGFTRKVSTIQDITDFFEGALTNYWGKAVMEWDV